jgi:serine phosphatase RsbU (regulator of sigma subunit)
MISRISSALIIAFLALPLLTFGQTEILVYDGYTGILNTTIRDDTAFVANVISESPAEKAGIRFRDQIIAINDSLIAGNGVNHRQLQDLLLNKSGEPIDFLIKRRGVDSLMHFSFYREPYMHQIVAFEYEYLIDSLEQWDISQITSDSFDSLFVNQLMAKSLVYSVEEGSTAAEIGILPGDRFISLEGRLDKDFHYHISSGAFLSLLSDTTLTVLRGDSLIHFSLKPSPDQSMKGVLSQFDHDLDHPCAWLKIKTVNRISENRLYLINLPYMAGTDSANFFISHPSGDFIEKRTGILVPVDERDFIYKNWNAASFVLDQGAEQTLYIRWKSDSHVGAPLMHLIAHETMVGHDRIERMVLYAFLGMMLIISCFFLILYFALRDRQYLFFSLYILFFAAFLFVSEGYLEEYHWRAAVFKSIFISGAQPFTLSLVTVFFLLFGISYLELKEKMSGWYWSVVVLLGLIGVRVIVMLLSSIFNFEIGGVFEDVVLVVWAFSVAIIPLFLLILPAIFRTRSGFTPALYFLIANLVLIPLTIITLDSSAFAFTSHALTESILFRIFRVSGVFIAAILQILIFSLGLARKMRLDEQEKKIAQKQIIDQLKENEKLKDKVNRELEQKVQERTREIIEQKEEIEAQRDEIEAQRDLVFASKTEITDSIAYAQRIQAAVLPHKSYLDKLIPEYFVLFKPRDVVSGDFYWIKEVGSSLVVVAADCTGHGVPGGFLSMLGITLLNELFVEGSSNNPGEILGRLRTKVKDMLAQEGNIRDQKDGMDMAVAIIDRKKKELQFAGAYNPLYLIRERAQLNGKEEPSETSFLSDNYELFELKGDKQPIGVHWEETDFSTHAISLKEKDSIYVFSDGYVDQYGGEERKKFKTHKFKALLLSVQSEPMEKQKQLIEKTFEKWRGDVEQIDDVCVVGVRI